MRAVSGSAAEDLFITLFEDVFGAEKTGFLYSQYPFYDIYQDARFADFLIETGGKRIAIEIDDDASHLPGHVSAEKHYDDLTKQNSIIHMGWALYRWPVRVMQQQPERVKDEMRIFIGNHPQFAQIADYLPTQRGRSFRLKEHQQEALDALREMRENRETIALIHHATGTGKTVTAICDAKSVGGRVLYIAHTKDLITQTADSFAQLWPEASVGYFVEGQKDLTAQVLCASVQSIALNLDLFHSDSFDYIIVDEAHHAAAETYQKVLSYFTPRFTLGLTATPDRMDGSDILEIFKKTAHKANIRFLEAKAQAENPHFSSNPISRWQQKRAIRKEYAAAKKSGGKWSFKQATTKAGQAAEKAKDAAAETVNTVRKHPVAIIILGLGGLLLFLFGGLQGCAPMVSSIGGGTAVGSYPAEEADVRAAERAYLAMERELKDEMDHYERYARQGQRCGTLWFADLPAGRYGRAKSLCADPV